MSFLARVITTSNTKETRKCVIVCASSNITFFFKTDQSKQFNFQLSILMDPNSQPTLVPLLVLRIIQSLDKMKPLEGRQPSYQKSTDGSILSVW